jgi:hypothetical protein
MQAISDHFNVAKSSVYNILNQFVFDSRQCNTCVPYLDLLALDSKVTQ